MMAEEFDLVILGSGSTAFAAALRAAESGKTAAMTEMRTLGGTCVNMAACRQRTSSKPRKSSTMRRIRATQGSLLPR